jgi:hypothetical protein
MKIIHKSITLNKLWEEREVRTSDLIKLVVDIEKQIFAADAEMHADLEELLLANGSRQQDLWGANIYPNRADSGFVEFTSFINVRPASGNRSMEVTDTRTREKIVDIINRLIKR